MKTKRKQRRNIEGRCTLFVSLLSPPPLPPSPQWLGILKIVCYMLATPTMLAWPTQILGTSLILAIK